MLPITAVDSPDKLAGTSILTVPIVADPTNETFANEPVPSTVIFVIVPYAVIFATSPIKVRLPTLSVIVSVSSTYLTSILLTILAILTVLIFEEVMSELILIVLPILETVNLVSFLKSIILTLSIVDVSLNTKVNVLGGGERIILSEVVFSIFSASNVEISPSVFIFAMSKVSLICSIDNDGIVVSDGGNN